MSVWSAVRLCLVLQVKAFLKVHATHISFTTDGWTTPQGRGHVAITVHAITKDFNAFQFCLAAKTLDGAHCSSSAVIF